MGIEATYGKHGPLGRAGGSGRASERFALALLPLLLAAAAAILLLLTLGWVDRTSLGPFAPLADPLLEFAAASPLSRLAVALSALVVGMFCTFFALRGLGERRSHGGVGVGSGQQHILAADEHGMVVVDAAGVATVAAAAARQASGVMDVRVVVVGRGASPIRLQLKAWVSAAAELQRAGNEVRGKAKEAVQRLVGIEVSEVVVKIEVVPLEELGRALR